MHSTKLLIAIKMPPKFTELHTTKIFQAPPHSPDANSTKPRYKILVFPLLDVSGEEEWGHCPPPLGTAVNGVDSVSAADTVVSRCWDRHSKTCSTASFDVMVQYDRSVTVCEVVKYEPIFILGTYSRCM